MSSNKNDYFKHRNKTLSTHPDRAAMGEREIVTLLTMLGSDGESSFALKGKSIIDLGCGDQYLKSAVEDRGAAYRGIDIDECNLEFQDFPAETNSYDVAVCLALIEHLRDPGHFLKETKRILKPGGAVWMSTPDIAACGANFWNDPTHVHPYTRSSFRMLLSMNGFVDVLVTPNYRCKSAKLYRDSNFNFFRARHLMFFPGTSQLPVPNCFKGKCSGLFALAKKPTTHEVER